LNLPERASEIRLNQYIDFIITFRRTMQDEGNAIEIMAQAVSDICGVDLNTILQAKIGDEYKYDHELFEGLNQIFGYLVQVIKSAGGELRRESNFTFEYKGETYELPLVKTVALVTGEVMPNVSVQQAVEAFEVIRLTNEAESKNGDENGSIAFSRYLNLLAVLSNKPGEIMPAKPNERTRWIAERANHFTEIDCQTALDVDFFLITILAHFGKTRRIVGSLSLPLFGVGAVTQKWNLKPIKKQRSLARTTSKG